MENNDQQPEWIDLDDLCAQVQKLAGDTFHVRVEHTGGGCATLMIFDGAAKYWQPFTNQYGNTYQEFTGKRALVAAGPGGFDGPNWTKATASVEEFCYGMDDDGTTTPVSVEEGWDDLEPGQLAREIHGYAEWVQSNIHQRWVHTPIDRRPYWWNADEDDFRWHVLDSAWVPKK